MKNIFKRFDLRVVVAIVATISCVVIVSDFLLFRFDLSVPVGRDA